MIDITKPLKAKVYDFDPSWDDSEGEDDLGKYVIREVEVIILPSLYIKQPEICCQGGNRSQTFKLIEQQLN